jgi:hypothetical protein
VPVGARNALEAPLGMPPNGTADSVRVETEAEGEYDNEMKPDVALLVANHTSTILTQHRYKDHTA